MIFAVNVCPLKGKTKNIAFIIVFTILNWYDSYFFSASTSPMPRNSLPRGAVPPGHNGLKSMTYAKSAPLQEFTNMDERMTNKLLSVQQQAVNLGKD